MKTISIRACFALEKLKCWERSGNSNILHFYFTKLALDLVIFGVGNQWVEFIGARNCRVSSPRGSSLPKIMAEGLCVCTLVCKVRFFFSRKAEKIAK